MKKIIMILGLASITACAQLQPVPLGSSATIGEPIFATLADANDPIEMAAAPVYTKLAAYRFAAARSLRANQITVAQAETAQRNADAVRALLDLGIKTRNLEQIKSASTLLDSYRGQQ